MSVTLPQEYQAREKEALRSGGTGKSPQLTWVQGNDAH